MSIEDAVRTALGPAGSLLSAGDDIFDGVVESNVNFSSYAGIPANYILRLLEYANSNASDGALLRRGFFRYPAYHFGGWILDIQTHAEAMTLDTDVFVHTPLHLDTYVHEMVHVGQYGLLGKSLFLISYFGLSLATILKRLVNREPLDPMSSSPHEMQAYELEGRFRNWLRAHYPREMGFCSVR